MVDRIRFGVWKISGNGFAELSYNRFQRPEFGLTKYKLYKDLHYNKYIEFLDYFFPSRETDWTLFLEKNRLTEKRQIERWNWQNILS